LSVGTAHGFAIVNYITLQLVHAASTLDPAGMLLDVCPLNTMLCHNIFMWWTDCKRCWLDGRKGIQSVKTEW